MALQKPFRVGILGAGYIADWHAKALKHVKDAKLMAVCDVRRARAEAFARTHGVQSVYESLDEMIEKAGIDVAHILAPPEHHAAIATKVIEMGKHVFVEKPMCATPEEARTLAALAEQHGAHLGVSHNFLFSPVYERLRTDVTTGRLGHVRSIEIIWRKELPQLRFGPVSAWMFGAPGNIMTEIGPHSIGHMLDLAGVPGDVAVEALDPVDLAGGGVFYRVWRVRAACGKTDVHLAFSFEQGATEHGIHVRGSMASASVDFEQNTYTLRAPTPYSLDFDRYERGVAEAKGLYWQTTANLGRYILSKLHLSQAGNPFGYSIARGMQCFYAGLNGSPDRRLGGAFGADVVDVCARIGSHAPLASRPPVAAAPSAASPCPEVLVLGGTGFIGRELVRQLVRQGRSVRVVTRDRNGMPPELRHDRVEAVAASIGDAKSMAKALEGIKYVYHLARASVSRWEDWLEQDVHPTRRFAEQCGDAGVRRFIYTGTISSCYLADPRAVITEETGTDPKINRRDNYSHAKALTEQLLLGLHRERGFPVVILRPGVVLGRNGSPCHWGVGMWSHEAICQFWGAGDTKLPAVLVEDVAAALVSAMSAEGIEGETFNLVGPPILTAREYIQEMERVTGLRFTPIPTPIARYYLADMVKWVVKCLVRHPDRRMPSYRDWDTRAHRAQFDCSKARVMLGWRPTEDRDTFIREGIAVPAAQFLK